MKDRFVGVGRIVANCHGTPGYFFRRATDFGTKIHVSCPCDTTIDGTRDAGPLSFASVPFYGTHYVQKSGTRVDRHFRHPGFVDFIQDGTISNLNAIYEVRIDRCGPFQAQKIR